MRRFLYLCAVLSIGLPAFGLEPLPKDLPHCDLAGPPNDAKSFELPHGNEFKLHPVAPGLSYTGCVWLWTNSDTQLVTLFERGQPKYYRDVNGGRRPAVVECSYEGSTLLKRVATPAEYPRRCPNPEELRDLYLNSRDK